jgi:hypothetical protein
MIDEKDSNDETPDTAEPSDAAPQADSTAADADDTGKVTDKELDDAAGAGPRGTTG